MEEHFVTTIIVALSIADLKNRIKDQIKENEVINPHLKLSVGDIVPEPNKASFVGGLQSFMITLNSERKDSI